MYKLMQLLLALSLPIATYTQQATLLGSGSRAAEPFYTEVSENFELIQPTITVQYNENDSFIGIQDLIAGTVNFTANYVPLTAQQIDQFSTVPLIFPSVVAGVALSYNLPGNPSITLTADQISGIYQGTITDWNVIDPTIPSTTIIPLARADEAGPTGTFTQYLSVAATNWPASLVGTEVAFPAPVQLVDGTALIQQLTATVGSIGYANFGAAAAEANLANALVVNASGIAIAPSVASIGAAQNDIVINPTLMLSAINSSDPNAYPIANFVTTVVNRVQPNLTTGLALMRYLAYIATTGQQFAAPNNFAPLSQAIVTQFLANFALFTIPGVSPLATSIILKYCVNAA